MGIDVHYFDRKMAKDFSLNEAVFMNHVLYWCYLNECNNRNFAEGRYWTTNSNDALQKIFDYWSKSQLETVIAKCKKSELLVIRIDNKKKLDRTRSFAPTDLAKSYAEKSEMHFSKIGNPFPKNQKCINKEKNNNTNNKKAHAPYSDQMGSEAAEMIAAFVSQDERLREAFDDYVDMRKKKKSPIKTLGTVKRLLSRLESLSGGDVGKMTAILDQSIRKGWTDIYPLSENRNAYGSWAPTAGGAEVLEQEDYSYGD
jgi:hypothetical protein